MSTLHSPETSHTEQYLPRNYPAAKPNAIPHPLKQDIMNSFFYITACHSGPIFFSFAIMELKHTLLILHFSLIGALTLPGRHTDFPTSPSSLHERDTESDHDDFLYPTNELTSKTIPDIITTHDHGPENMVQRTDDGSMVKRMSKRTFEDSSLDREDEGMTPPSSSNQR